MKKLYYSVSTLLAASLFSVSPRLVEAFPTGPEWCRVDIIDQGPHVGTLNYTGFFDHYSVWFVFLMLPAREDLQLELRAKSPDKLFKGFLFHLSFPPSIAAIDLSGPFSNPDDFLIFRSWKAPVVRLGVSPLLARATDESVAEATHTGDANNQAYDKESVVVAWNLDSSKLIASGNYGPSLNPTIFVMALTAKDEHSSQEGTFDLKGWTRPLLQLKK
jgi:hypothetical protein